MDGLSESNWITRLSIRVIWNRLEPVRGEIDLILRSNQPASLFIVLPELHLKSVIQKPDVPCSHIFLDQLTPSFNGIEPKRGDRHLAPILFVYGFVDLVKGDPLPAGATFNFLWDGNFLRPFLLCLNP